MKKIGLLKAIALTHKADRMTGKERYHLQQKRLKALISYVKKNSPYYAKLYQSMDENAPLSAFPVTNKVEMMAHYDEWLTDLLKIIDPFVSSSTKSRFCNKVFLGTD